MGALGKTLILFGVILIGVGALLVVFQKIPFPGKLPGDIYVKRENFTFYFPLATSLLVSIILSVIMWFLSRR